METLYSICHCTRRARQAISIISALTSLPFRPVQQIAEYQNMCLPCRSAQGAQLGSAQTDWLDRLGWVLVRESGRKQCEGGREKKCFNELMLRSKSMWRLAGGSCAYNFRCDFLSRYSIWMIWRLRSGEGWDNTYIWSSGHEWCSGKGGGGADFTGVTILLGWQRKTLREKGVPSLFMPSSQQVCPMVTLTAHFMTSAVSSDTTRSTHLRLGSLSLRICFLTIASKARSGVKSPVLKGHGVRLHFVVVVERQG